MLDRTENYSYVVSSVAETERWIIKSAHRVFQIFEYFCDVRHPSSATEISHALGFPQSSTSMLLRSLVALGYLDYSHDARSFEPTIRLSLLGGWVPQRIDVANHVIETINRLHEEFDETIVLGEAYRNYVRYIYVLQQPNGGFYVPCGTLRQICLTAPGRMLLTLSSDREILSIIHRSNAELDDPALVIKRQEFLEIIAKCREEGFSYTERPQYGRQAINAAVLLPVEGARPLAVAVIADRRRYEAKAEHIKNRLIETARGG